jgi:O-antigen/teichoic acid export membrane protein
VRPFFSHWSARVWRSSVLFAALATALRVGMHVVLLPVILIYLTPTDQAIWWVFVALGNFANLVDFGFGQAIVRVYNFLWAGAEDFETEGLRPLPEARPPNITRIAELNRIVQLLYRRLSVAAVAVLAIAGTFYLSKAFPDSNFATKLLPLWIAYLIAVGFNVSTLYWLIACQGINRVRDVQLAYVWSSLAFLFAVLTSLALGAGLASMVIGAFARGFVLRQITYAAFHKAIPSAQIPGNLDLSILRRLWPNARKFGMLSITGYWAANGLVLMSGYFLDPHTTASVGATTTVGNLLVGFAGMWLTVKWPQITILRTQGRLQEMSGLFARRLAFSVLTFVALASGIALLGNLLLEWRQSSTRFFPTPLILVYFLYLLQQFVYVQFANLVFTENVVPFCGISLLTCAAMIGLSLLLAPRWGLWGLILSPLIAESLISAWVVVRRGFHSQSMSLHQFFRLAMLGRP